MADREPVTAPGWAPRQHDPTISLERRASLWARIRRAWTEPRRGMPCSRCDGLHDLALCPFLFEPRPPRGPYPPPLALYEALRRERHRI